MVYNTNSHTFYINFQVRINRSVVAVAFSRFVLMHMIATNMCVWFQTIIMESLREINELEEILHSEDTVHHYSHHTTPSPGHTTTVNETLAVAMALSE